MVSAEKPTILLTFDVEDWFQVENFKASIPLSAWDRCELRVWDNTLRILDILDNAPGAPRATFFILGWIAKKRPALVRTIQGRGHEIASHGLAHGLCTSLASDDMAADLKESKSLLEDLTGAPVTGYRAPSFSIDPSVLALIREAGYLYDSSYNSFSGHGRYGRLDLSRAERRRGYYRLDSGLIEIPVSNLRAGRLFIPLGGGGYFRLYPFSVFQKGMAAVLKRENTFVFYAHPWEFDPGQPRVHSARAGFRFRHYINLSQTQAKLTRLITAFPDAIFTTCSKLIELDI